MKSQKKSKASHNGCFEVNGGGVAVYQPGDVFGPHFFQSYEFVWIMEGDVKWEVDGKSYLTPPDTLCLMQPGTVQTFFWDKNRSSRHAYFFFSFQRDRQVFPSDQKLPLLRKMTAETIYEPLFRHILWLTGEGHRDSLQISAALSTLLEAFISGAAESPADVGRDFPESIVRSLRFARQKWEEGVLLLPTLKDLAHHAGVSRAQLYRHFMSCFGMGPLTAIRLVRLDEASLRLAKNTVSIKEIAETTGFSSAYHFSKAFKDVSGLSPKEFRKRVQSGQAVRPLPKLSQVRQMKRIILEAD